MLRLTALVAASSPLLGPKSLTNLALEPACPLAMGVDPQEALGSVRLTPGRRTTMADVDRAAQLLGDAWRNQFAAAGEPPR